MALFDGRFYDLNVRINPEAQEPISGIARTAKKYGYSGIVILNPVIKENEIINRPEGFSICTGIEIAGKASKLRNEIRKHANKKDILIVPGGDENTNRAAVESEELDILMHPPKFNHVLAKLAGDNSVSIGFDTGSLIRKRGEARVRDLSIMRKNLKLARKYDLSMILTNSPGSCYDIRSPRETAALAALFGMTGKEAANAMSTEPLNIFKKKSQNYIREGIEIL